MPQESRSNNFNLVRLIGALLVMIGHMGPIMGTTVPVFGQDLHGIGVEILFLIGGYLVAQSWMKDPHPVRYGIKRFLRLWPPFAFMILLMTFVTGPLLSNLGKAGYFGSWWTTYLQNLRFYIIYAQPGVFTENPISYVTNGSLWTMPVELALYFVTPLVTLIFGIGKNRRYSFPVFFIFCLAMIGVGLWLDMHPDTSWIFYATDWAAGLKLGIYYLIGMLCSMKPMRKWFRMEWTPIAFLAIILLQYEARPVQYLTLIIALPYIVFSLALAPGALFGRVGTKYELSYGIYLYGFFFQQLTVLWQQKTGISLGVPGSFVVSLCMTVAAAFLSCVLIEKPMQRLSRSLTHRLKQPT